MYVVLIYNLDRCGTQMLVAASIMEMESLYKYNVQYCI